MPGSRFGSRAGAAGRHRQGEPQVKLVYLDTERPVQALRGGLEPPRVATIGARDGQLAQQPGHAHVQRTVAVATGAVGQRAGEPALPNAGRSADEDVEVFADPAPVGRGRALSEVDVLDAASCLKPVGERRRSVSCDRSRPSRPRQGVDLGGVELLRKPWPSRRSGVAGRMSQRGVTWRRGIDRFGRFGRLRGSRRRWRRIDSDCRWPAPARRPLPGGRRRSTWPGAGAEER